MGHAMNVLTALLVCLAAASAVPVHFPHGKTVIYKYNANVKTGTAQPAPFASEFGIDALLHVRHDTSDPTLKNAYQITLTDVKYGLHNGEAGFVQHVDVSQPIVEAARMIQDPFLVVYDETGKFQGVKLVETESGWSKNMKQAIASMIQLDLTNIHVQTPVKSHSFITHENTIHGTCQVAYDVHPKDQVHPESTNVFVVTKVHDPRSCTHFVQRVFDHVDCEHCHVESEDAMTSVSRRVFEIEDQGSEILIKNMLSTGVINYFPWLARSEAHYLLTNQTLVLESVVPVTTVQVPSAVNFQNVPLVRDVTFNKPQGNYALLADEDVTQGRHIVKLDVLIPKLKKMLGEAADYLEENHMEMKQPDWKHGQTINRLLHTMSFMDLGSLEQVYHVIQDAKTPRDVTIRNIFLGMVPNVGTVATSVFTRNVIRKHKVTDLTAMSMLHKLPMHVKIPSERLLLEMEDLVKFGDSVSFEVRKASILCFSTLIHKTFKTEHTDIVNPLLERYLQHFMDHVKNEPTYQMKMVYLMAIKNVGVGNIHKILEPIIRGDLVVSEKPVHIRVQAIWAIKNVVVKDITYVHDLLWPILADVSLPVTLRIAAYEVLINQLPHTGRMMNIQWLMVHETNQHLYNYHLTTMRGLANSVDPCLRPVRELARKVLRFTAVRPVTTTLSTKYHVDYIDEVYGHGETLKAALIVDQLTGLPHVGSVEHFTTVARKPVNQLGVHWSITGLDEIMKEIKCELFGESVEGVTNENVKNILRRAAQDMPAHRDIDVDIFFTMNDHVILANHYDKNTWTKLFDDVKQWRQHFTDAKINWQQVMYENLYEMHVPTDLGVPTVLATRIPTLTSMKLNTILSEVNVPLNLKLELDARIWRHGEHVMSVYNPIADVWHSVRRTTSRDVVLPLEMNIGYNAETKSLKVTLPRLPATKLSVSGIAHHAKNYVTVTDDETDMLKKSCATCHHHEVVTSGVPQKKVHQSNVDLKDTGLQYLMAIFDCEGDCTPTKQRVEWHRAMTGHQKNTMDSQIVHLIMVVRQILMNEMIAPQVGRCGSLIKVEPSILHPTSHVDVNVRLNVDDLDYIHDTLHVLSSKKVNVRGTVDAKAASTNASVRLWDVNVNIDLSQGHVNNNMKVMMTRVTPGEKNLKICIDAQKNYPVINIDPLKLGTTKEETNSKMTITMGQTDEDKCVRDDTVITTTIKGEMSEEQKKHMTHDSLHGVCIKHIQNPQLQTQDGHVPKTTACIQETIQHTTLRKYTVNVAHKKVPQTVVTNVIMLQDIFCSIFLPHVDYTTTHVDSGNVKIHMEYPDTTSHLDLSVITPTHGYEMSELPFGHPLWNIWMDNTRMSIPTLYKYVNGQTNICTIHPQVLLTFDNGTIPFVVSDQWTLMSGNHVDQTFAIFVKSVQGNRIAMKLHVGEHELEIVPTVTKPVVTVNGNVVDHHEKGVVVPADEPNSYAFKMTKNNEHLLVQSQRVPLMLMCTSNSITVLMDNVLQGQVTGMCGHMDGTHKDTIPKIYSTVHL